MYLCSVCGATNPKYDKCFATPPTALPPDISAVYESVNRHQVANASSAGPPVRPVAHLCLDGRIKDVPSARCKASHTRDCDLVYINEVDRLLAALRAALENLKRLANDTLEALEGIGFDGKKVMETRRALRAALSEQSARTTGEK